MAIEKTSKAGVRSLAGAPVQADTTAKADTGIKMHRPGAPLAGLDPAVVQKRLELGRKALHGEEGREAALAPPSYFRTYEQLKAGMVKLCETYPTLLKMADIGDTFEKKAGKADRDILSLVATSPKGGDKARVLHIGGQHAREIANPELLMKYVEWLCANYGKDAEATATLDNCIIDIVPMMNPDGHAVVEKGYTGERGGDKMKRKNTSGSGGQGTDENRNWPTKNWGTAGTSHSQGSETYCGPSAGSEEEIKAIVAHIADTKPKFFIDWHSYSELVLYPPDDDRKNTTPDQEHFIRVGKKMASFNGYTPQASIELYPTSGGSFLPYEKHGIASFCVETGTAFHQTDAQFAETWKKNFPVLQYAAKIAHDWKGASAGADIMSASFDSRGQLHVKAVDTLTGKPAKAIEVVSSLAQQGGSGVTIVGGRKGAFTGQNIAKQFAPVSGRTLIYVRAQSEDGHWGPAKAMWVSAVATKLAANAVRPMDLIGKKSA